ncbi:MAG: VanZ family protein [Cryobacterium sp.]|uniref:VanZ family protein n=1 Tax=unclassified Cryobacterium TaxID=2649013 RepID=UPI0018C96D1A|nr:MULTISPECIES: VanZ family protein [unclassified Cryobacterium]MCY7405464.1 VanZ family protein [Cryobacterium sp.]MEC5153512.1 glycopeptide antibiotics resistance protein [Cryobacterium sp. CAN_C3]
MTAIRRHRLLRRVALWIALAYIAVLALVAFWPTPVDSGAHGSISSIVLWLHAHGIPAWLDYAVIEFSANIALFIPVGLLVVVLAGARHWWLGSVVGAGVSCAIEFGQLVFLPERFAAVNDVIANSLGALLGTAVAAVVLHLFLGPASAPVSAAQKI